jgi:hypothetical protein
MSGYFSHRHRQLPGNCAYSGVRAEPAFALRGAPLHHSHNAPLVAATPCPPWFVCPPVARWGPISHPCGHAPGRRMLWQQPGGTEALESVQAKQTHCGLKLRLV